MESKATIRTNVEGKEQTKRDLEEIKQAQESLTESQKPSSQSGSDKSPQEEQGNLNDLLNEFILLMGKEIPQLGSYADGLRRAFDVAGKLSDKKIELGKITELATKSLTKYASSFALIGAGSLALGSLFVLRRTWQNLGKDIDSVNRKMDEFTARQARQRENQIGTEDSVSAAANRQREPVSADDRSRAAKVAELLKRRGVDGGIATNITGALAGNNLAEGSGISIDDLAAFSRLIESGDVNIGDDFFDYSDTAQRNLIEASLNRNKTKISGNQNATSDIQSQRAQKALRQLNSLENTGDIFGSNFSSDQTADLEMILRELRDGYGADVPEDGQSFDELLQGLLGFNYAKRNVVNENMKRRVVSNVVTDHLGTMGRGDTLDRDYYARLENITSQLEAIINQRIENKADQQSIQQQNELIEKQKEAAEKQIEAANKWSDAADRASNPINSGITRMMNTSVGVDHIRDLAEGF